MEKQFETHEVFVMRCMATSLITQIKNRSTNDHIIAELKVPNLHFLTRFHEFLRQCGVVMTTKISIFVHKVYDSPATDNTDSVVLYRKNEQNSPFGGFIF